jgi:hypothetical protein
MTRNGDGPSMLARLFADAGNPLRATATGFNTSHEPVHSSESRTCVSIDTEKNVWYCHSCQRGGGMLQAIMSLKGLSRAEAKRDLRKLMGETGPDDDNPKDKMSQATRLVHIAEDASELFHDSASDTYASVTVDDHREVWYIRTKGFRYWLLHQYYLAHDAVPNGDAVSVALQTLEGKALFDGECREVYLRIAPDGNDGIYLDLGDATWRVVHVTPAGWQLVTEAPVMFRRSAGMLPLPEPVRGRSLDELRPLMNLPADQAGADAIWVLLKAWLVAALMPSGPFPIVALRGEQGTAKTTLAKILKGLVDPAKPALRSDPRELRDLAIAARGCWMIGFDNVSHIQAWLSDALCRMSTGSGWATRELYTDRDEVLFEAMRPVILNGITEYVVAPDLLDRTIQVELPTIPKHKRRRERRRHPDEPEGVLDAFDAKRPQLLGALLDAVAGALRALPTVHLSTLPRMADFPVIGAAAEKAEVEHSTTAPPWSETASPFLRAYDASIQEAQGHAIEGSVIGPTLLKWLE